MVIIDGLFYTPEMSAGLSESQNYIWNTHCSSDFLGEGAFGKVYLGVDRRNGDKVAVKTYKQNDQCILKEIQMLQTLKHQYIIQLHGVEIESRTQSYVMVMEFCNSGSLMKFLNQPENVCGVSDSEFLLVLEHLSRGLEFLNKHSVIHRDVKPDNIMRHVSDDGNVIYKLADFGTARELPEGQNFDSIHGTEPYLNPHIFRVAFSGRTPTISKFGANTDLWSIGVTLYQTATGKMPFNVQRYNKLRVYDKMKNNEGIIEATQDEDQIIYEKTLPQNIQLSCGLKELITPIIAGLFIQLPEKQWSFAQYYEQVLNLVFRKVINVFYINEMRTLKVYMKAEESFNDFKNYIYEQTQVEGKDQVFLYKQRLIVNRFDDFESVNSGNVFLFNRSSSNVIPTNNTQLVFENLSNFQSKLLSGLNPDDESKLARVANRDLCICKNFMDYQSSVFKFFDIFIKDFDDYCKEERKEMHQVYDILLEKYSTIKDSVGILEKLERLTESHNSEFVGNFETTTNNFKAKTTKLFEDLDNIKTDVTVVTSHDSYLKIVVNKLAEMKMLRQMDSTKYCKTLYEYEKIKIVHCVRTVMELLTDKMVPNFETFVDDVKRWYKDTFFTKVRILSLLKNLFKDYKDVQRRFEVDVHAKNEDNLDTITKIQKVVLDKKKLLEMLQRYKESNADLKSILDDKLRLDEKMARLMETLNVNDSTAL